MSPKQVSYYNNKTFYSPSGASFGSDRVRSRQVHRNAQHSFTFYFWFAISNITEDTINPKYENSELLTKAGESRHFLF